MIKLEVFDPPMCCSTGVCGPSVDPALVQFAADLQWLAGRGVEVARYNLAQQPQAFAEEETVKAALAAEGNDCLPLILVHGEVVSRGSYPDRTALAALAGLEAETEPPSIYTEAIAELVAIGAAIAANCEPCFKFHFEKARKLGVSKDDMMRAVQTAQMVKETPARNMLKLAQRYLEGDSAGLPIQQSCCG